MSAPPLIFRQLAVRRMPGFPRAGFTLDALGPGINIIHGPNASGKTTAATALNLLLWPRRDTSRHASLFGRFELDGCDWSVDLDGGRAAYQCDAADADPPLLPPDDSHDRYNLALHELLSDKNESFAQTIRRESAGGYDVAAAKAALGFRDGPSAPRQAARAVDAARQALRSAQQEQEALWQAEQRLAALNAELQQAAAARRRAELLQLALDHAEAADEHRAAQAALAAFPAATARITGTETADLAALRKERVRLAQEAHATRHAILQAKQDIADCRLPDDGVSAALLVALRESLQELQSLTATVRTAEREMHAAQAARDQEARRIGDAVNTAQLEALDAASFDDLAEFAHEAEQLRGRQTALGEVQRWLGQPEAVPDIESLQDGRRLLLRWLREDARSARGRDGRAPWLATGAGLVATTAAVVLALSAHWAWLGLALVALVLAGLAWLPPRAGESAGVYRREYEALQLDGPADWTPAGVTTRIDELDRALAAATLEQERSRLRHEYESRAAQDAPKAAALAARKEALVTRLGIAPDIDEAKLYWLVGRVSAWHDAARDAHETEAVLITARQQREEILQRIRATLLQHDYLPVADAADLLGQIEDLDRRRQRWTAAQAELQAARQRQEDLRRQIERLNQREQALFRQRGLTAGDEALLDECCRARDSYLSAKRQAEQTADRLARAAERLKAHPLYEPALDHALLDELQRGLQDAKAAAARWDDRNREIIEIQTRIDDAKRGHDVEAALAELERSRAALAEQRDRDCAAVVGAAIAGFIEQQSREHQRPAVFRRARTLLADITRGRYRLDLTDDDVPAFRATDEIEHTGHALDELSSATRVQLLLAVRVAFVETQEQGVRLPLLLDELLANSDDTRAAEIIDAIASIAATGRQVFYFTAQADEVGKWVGLLRQRSDVPHRIIDLAQARGLGQVEHSTLTVAPVPVRTVPAPGSMSYGDYGRALRVPPMDPHADARAAHLWYVLDDASTLHRLLSRGVERWGQLQALLAHHDDLLDADARRRAQSSAALIETACRDWRIGRGQRVDRQTLINAGVTDAFIDPVSELAVACGGDAAALLAALENGRVKRFRSAAIDSLRDYFLRTGHLDDATPLSAAQIRRRAAQAAESDLQTGRLTMDQLDRILAGILGPQPSRDAE